MRPVDTCRGASKKFFCDLRLRQAMKHCMCRPDLKYQRVVNTQTTDLIHMKISLEVTIVQNYAIRWSGERTVADNVAKSSTFDASATAARQSGTGAWRIGIAVGLALLSTHEAILASNIGEVVKATKSCRNRVHFSHSTRNLHLGGKKRTFGPSASKYAP
jgi:hypothetical protein